MCIATAVEMIRGRQSGRQSDKLAIIGNLTEYHWRLDTSVTAPNNEVPSLSALLLALALYNGDLSLSFAFGFPMVTAYRRPGAFDGRPMNRSLPDWLPDENLGLDQFRSSIVRALCKPERGGKGLVIGGELFFKGLLWQVEPFHGLLVLQEAVTQQHREPQLPGRPMHTACFKLILCKLFELGRRDIIVALLTHAYSGLGSSLICLSPTGIFTVVDELEDCFHGHKIWDQVFKSQGLDPDSLVCRRTEDGQPLAVGSCTLQGEHSVTAVFDYDANLAVNVFTPSNHLIYEFGDPTMREGKIWANGGRLLSWAVEKAERTAGEDAIASALRHHQASPTKAPTPVPSDPESHGSDIQALTQVGAGMRLKIVPPGHLQGYWTTAISSSRLLVRSRTREVSNSASGPWTYMIIPIDSGMFPPSSVR